MSPVRTVILGAAGRDFHNFNVVYRDDPSTRVVAFTATQIPGIADRRYPASLAGPLYPDGIPIEEEAELEEICARHSVERVVFAYSDVPHDTVMHAASRALACGADFTLLGPERTMLEATVPTVAVSAVRTGCGKSQVARWIGKRAREARLRVAAIRHPMPYGDLDRQRVQRFASIEDIDAADCSAEEREEYEPHVAMGNVVFAGVDYAEIMEQAEDESDVIVWDGGNNDFPFLKPDLHIVVVDALRPNQLTTHHPGETVLRMADVVVINKVDVAATADVQRLAEGVWGINARAKVVQAASPVALDNAEAVRGKRVLIVEDGPTITHGGMPYGAGYVAASAVEVSEVVDPRQSASEAVRRVYEQYPHIGPVLPAVGYGPEQLDGLRETIEASVADVVIAATPIDLAALIPLSKPVVRARYEYADAGEPSLASVIDPFLAEVARKK